MKNGMAIIDLGRVSVLVFESAKTREALVELLKSGPHHMTRIAVGPEDASDADLEAAIRVSVAEHPCEAADAPVVVARGGKAFATLAWPIDLDVIRSRMEPRPFRLLEQVTDCIQPVQEQAVLDRAEAEDALRALEDLQTDAEASGASSMSLPEINALVEKSRAERRENGPR